MAIKIFLDANVILDSYLHRENSSSDKLMQLVSDRKVDASISSSILHICSYWLRKEFTSAETRKLLNQLVNYVQIIDISHHNAVLALQSSIKDIEDALQYYSAVQHGLDFFISSDKELLKSRRDMLPVCSPTEFLKTMKLHDQ